MRFVEEGFGALGEEEGGRVGVCEGWGEGGGGGGGEGGRWWWGVGGGWGDGVGEVGGVGRGRHWCGCGRWSCLEGWFGVESDCVGGKWVVEVLRKWWVMDVVVLVCLWL